MTEYHFAECRVAILTHLNQSFSLEKLFHENKNFSPLLNCFKGAATVGQMSICQRTICQKDKGYVVRHVDEQFMNSFLKPTPQTIDRRSHCILSVKREKINENKLNGPALGSTK